MNSPLNYDRVYFDGTCGLCHWFVRLLIRLDPQGTAYRFSHGDPGADSVVIVSASGDRYVRSDAVLYALHRAGGWWGLLSRMGRLLPRAFRDRAYDWIARNRRRLVQSCPVMPPEFRARFL